ELAEEWRQRTGIRIVRGYGMTELFRPISYLARDATESPEAIGRAVPGVEVRTVDDAGRALPAGEVGELWLKRRAAMHGYVPGRARPLLPGAARRLQVPPPSHDRARATAERRRKDPQVEPPRPSLRRSAGTRRPGAPSRGLHDLFGRPS